MSMVMQEEFKRRTAKRKASLVKEIIQGTATTLPVTSSELDQLP